MQGRKNKSSTSRIGNLLGFFLFPFKTCFSDDAEKRLQIEADLFFDAPSLPTPLLATPRTAEKDSLGGPEDEKMPELKEFKK